MVLRRKRRNMYKVIIYLLNIIFFIVISLIVIGISTIALVQKVNYDKNQYQYSQVIKGTVIKQVIPIITVNTGIVEKINIAIGDEVKKGDTLMILTNPSIDNEIKALKQFPSNVSAQTQEKVDEQKLQTLKIIAPSDAIVDNEI